VTKKKKTLLKSNLKSNPSSNKKYLQNNEEIKQVKTKKTRTLICQNWYFSSNHLFNSKPNTSSRLFNLI